MQSFALAVDGQVASDEADGALHDGKAADSESDTANWWQDRWTWPLVAVRMPEWKCGALADADGTSVARTFRSGSGALRVEDSFRSGRWASGWHLRQLRLLCLDWLLDVLIACSYFCRQVWTGWLPHPLRLCCRRSWSSSHSMHLLAPSN